MWGTGNVGRPAVRAVVADPDLELAAVVVSAPDKVGRDAADLAGLGAPTGVTATVDAAAVLADGGLDVVVYAATGDTRPDAAVDDIVACLRAGADAAGCEVDLEWVDPAYDEMVHDDWLLARYAHHAAALDRPLEDPEIDGPVVGSTDMGNVSHRVPSIHPMVAVAPRGVPIHTPEFATHARSAAGDRAAVDGAVLLAATAVDRWLRDR